MVVARALPVALLLALAANCGPPALGQQRLPELSPGTSNVPRPPVQQRLPEGDARPPQAMPPQQRLAGTGGRAGEVCTEDRGAALANALERHRQLIQMILLTKGIPENRRLETDPSRFERQVRAYLAQRSQSALVLYALDAGHLCAFLWTGQDPFIYARTPAPDELLAGPTRQLSAGVITRAAERIEAVAKRVGVLRSLSAELAPGPAPTSGPASAAGPAELLSRLLFPEPFHAALRRVRHLSIVPVGAISSVPLAVLTPFGTGERVVDLFAVNIMLFASEVATPPMRWRAAFERPLIMGNPRGRDVFDQQVPIPKSEAEAAYVAAKYKAAPVSGAAATTIAFITRAPAADLIYIAAHGIAGSGEHADPLRDSYIVLADNKLPASTIKDFGYSGGLKARLVVLSACQTGLGRVTEAGVVGLARTFLDAGARNVVMSNWNVDDDATGVLMRYFVDALDSHQPSEALRLAQLELMRSHPDPVYWAAFNVFGNHFEP